MVDWTSFALGNVSGVTLAGLGLAMALVLLAFVLVFYIYKSLAWMTIARKLKYKHPWIAWIPLANVAMLLQLGGFNWKWIFLVLVPILGWVAIAVMVIIATWRIFEKRKYPGWLSLLPIATYIPMVGPLASIAFLVAIGLVAWKDR